MAQRQASLEDGGAAPAPILRELSEAELESRFGAFVTTAEEAFHQDPQYLVEMVQQASILVYKKALWAAKAASAASSGTVREEMDAQGVLIPMQGQRARRRSMSV